MRFRLGGLPCYAPGGAPLPRDALAAAARRDLQVAPPAPLAPCGAAAAQQQHPATGAEQAAQQAAQQAQQAAPWVWESPAYEVRSLDELQRFPIPPTLCVGGYLRVELLGKRQRQAADDQFYCELTCAGLGAATGRRWPGGGLGLALAWGWC